MLLAHDDTVGHFLHLLTLQQNIVIWPNICKGGHISISIILLLQTQMKELRTYTVHIWKYAGS